MQQQGFLASSSNRSGRWWCAAAIASLLALAGGPAVAAEAPAASLRQLDGITLQTGSDAPPALVRTVTRAQAATAAAPLVRLDPFIRPKAVSIEGRVRIGAARSVDATLEVGDLSRLLEWHADPTGGQAAALRFQSPDAVAVRLGLAVRRLPPGTVLRVSGGNAASAIEISASQVLESIRRNLDAGIEASEARLYWLPTMEGDTVALEIALPPGVDPAQMQVAAPRLGHMWATDDAAELASKAAGACNVDVMCIADRDDESRAVARMRFADGGFFYLCTGTLLNNARQDFTPYFLTANHCIDNQASASSLETRWFYRSSACNAGTPGPNVSTLAAGATLLYNSASTDTTFLRLGGTPPAGVVFSGWDANVPTGSGAVESVTHPDGDLQKIALGRTTGFANCTATGGGNVSCTSATQQTGSYLFTRWTSGVTEGGSSGGPLFVRSGNQGRVIGQLFAGASSCSNPTGTDSYGRLDLAYDAALSQWLSPSNPNPPNPPVPPGAHQSVYRFYNASTGAHFYTISAAERDFVIASYPVFAYEGPVFLANQAPGAGLSPIFRFFNRQTGAHFYTISVAERDFVIANFPVFNYEGIAWYARATSGAGTSPIYRFFNTRTGTHFYTISAAERDFVIANYPVFDYEGIAYYAWPEP